MKIDASCIDHNTVRIISDILDAPTEYSDADENSDHYRLVILGQIRGVIDMANAMKEVLEA